MKSVLDFKVQNHKRICYRTSEKKRSLQKAKSMPTQRAPDPRTSTWVMMVGVAAFSGNLCNLNWIPLKWRPLVPPTSPHQGATQRVTLTIG